MRKLSFFLLGVIVTFSFLFSCFIHSSVTVYAKDNLVYVGGMTAGFTLKSGNVQIVGVCEVVTENGVISPSFEAGLRTGDRIVRVKDVAVETVAELNEIVDKCQGKTINIDVIRGENELTFPIKPVQDRITKRYKIGVLARDSVSGIGTVTYIDATTRRFAALGHSVIGENKRELSISDGIVYECSVVGVSKGIRGKAGELRGMFLSDKTFGTAEKLCSCGIFGRVTSDVSLEKLTKVAADSSEATMGKAYIYSTVNGTEIKRFSIDIVKVDRANKENKNYVIKISDKDLLDETGGIVQGMSGSPIIQNGKMIGAVTHVFLNDPTRGYGIDIKNMLKE